MFIRFKKNENWHRFALINSRCMRAAFVVELSYETQLDTSKIFARRLT